VANGRVYIKRLIVRSAFLVVAASAIGLIVNAVRTPNVDLFGYKPPKQKIVEAAKPGEKAIVSEIDLATAIGLQKTQGVLFVDARKKVEFDTGHIPAAINIPSEDFEKAFPPHKQSLVKADKIVTYCTDIECDESFELAARLREALGRSILVFAGGMKEYQGKGPVER